MKSSQVRRNNVIQCYVKIQIQNNNDTRPIKQTNKQTNKRGNTNRKYFDGISNVRN